MSDASNLRAIAATIGLEWDAEYRQHAFDTLNAAATELERARDHLRELCDMIAPTLKAEMRLTQGLSAARLGALRYLETTRARDDQASINAASTNTRSS